MRIWMVLAVAVIGAMAVAVILQKPHAPPRTTSLAPALWATYSARFIEGGRVVDHDNDGITHSESQGYGMLLAEAAGDRVTFDALWFWTRETLTRPDDLFSWRFGPCAEAAGGCVTDQNNATDGEILIAWALLRAAERWSDDSYRHAAATLSQALVKHTIKRRHGRLVLLPGFHGFEDLDSMVVTTNPSYWVFPAMEALADAFPDAPWAELAAEGRRLIDGGRFGQHALPPDWLGVSGAGLAPSPLFEPVYGFNAVRVPLHLAWSREPMPNAVIAAFEAFWAAPPGPPPAWVNLTDNSVAPYPWSNGVAAIAHFTRARAAGREVAPDTLPLPGAEDGYFSWSLALLARVAAAETGS